MLFSLRQVAIRLRARAELLDVAKPVKLNTVREIDRRANLVRFTISAAGEAIVASTDAPLHGSRHFSFQSDESQAYARNGWPIQLQAIRENTDRLLMAELALHPTQWIDTLPDGALIIVEARVARTDPQPNATVVDSNGSPQDSFIVGDDVSCLRATSQGRIWISYGDEGATENAFGESAGLSRWTVEGECVWPAAHERAGSWRTDYVNGFNLADEVAWVWGTVSVGVSGVRNRSASDFVLKVRFRSRPSTRHRTLNRRSSRGVPLAGSTNAKTKTA